MIKFLITTLAAMITLQGFAQTPKSFPDDDEGFLTGFSAYVAKSKRTESINAATEFASTYEGLSAALKTDVKATANMMLKNKVRNYPTFTEYAKIITLIASANGEGVPKEHITILKELIEASKPSAYKQFESYIKYLPNLFEGRYLFKTKTKAWVFKEGASYTVTVDDGKAALKFNGVDIVGMSRSDTLTIYNTSGKCFPVSKSWVGKSGKINFTKAGYSEAEALANLSTYEIALDKGDFSFDSVTLTFPKHIEGQILGALSEKLYSSKPQTISYPKFTSYDLNLNVKNIDERVSTSGGLKLLGDRIIIYGTEEKNAEFILSTNGKKQAVASAPSFIVRKDKNDVFAEKAEVSLYMKKDSLYHPAIIFKFLMEDNILRLERGEGIYVNVPYESAFHQMAIDLNSLQWNLDSTNIQFKTVDRYTGRPVAFTSYDHYVPQGELQYLTLTGRNPLRMLRDLSESYGTDYLTGHDIAGQLGYPLKEVESIIYKLAKAGFVFYNPTTKEMRVNYKTHHYMAAGKGDIDYDHLQFISENTGDDLNGVLSLDSQTIKLFGIEEFALSVPKKVKIMPRNEEMVLLENRDMDLEGTLTADKLVFKGKGIHFDYEDFKVDMQSVDSLIIFVAGEENELGERRDVALKTIISDIKGALFIDEPGNKSGLNDYQEYPFFESYDTAYVYFDSPEDSTKFQRENFYFQVFPFTLDSIVVTQTDSISFEGRLVSNDIFNPFVTQLSSQPDYTLGINEVSPPEGLDIYKSSGKFFNKYSLQEEGLRGTGTIKYRQAVIESENFKFYDDSLYAVADSFYMIPDVTNDAPQLTSAGGEVHWLPYKDSLWLVTDNIYTFYDGQLEFNGDIAYASGVLFGIPDSGTLSSDYVFGNGRIVAESSTFNEGQFTATNGSLTITTEEGIEAVNSNFTTANVNFKTGIVTVENAADTLWVDLPNNKLLTNIMNYNWNMETDILKFNNDEEVQQYFLSTLPELDSLKFYAANATYDIKEVKLEANEIEDISIADSKLIPPGKKLVILAGGVFDEMHAATLILNKDGEYHTLDNVNVVVRSRNDLSGTGNFKYIGNTGKEYNVHIDEIKVVIDTISQSRKNVEIAHTIEARGVITEEDQFRLDEQLLYKGNMFLYATQKDIEFDGFGRLDLKQNEDPSWFNLSQGIDPDNFSIGLDSLVNESMQTVVTGLFVSPSELEVYSAIMEPTRSVKDNILHQAEGSLWKGGNSGEFVFGKEDAVKGTNPNGSVMKYNDNTGTVEIDGHITWAPEIPLVKVDGYGTLNYNPATKSASGKSVIAIDFPMDEDIWYQLPRDIVEYNFNAESIEYDKPEIIRALKYFIPEKNEINTIIEDIEAEGLFKLPLTFSHKMLLTDVELNWDPIDGNFKSTNVIGLSSIGGFPIDLQIKAYTEFGYNFGTSYMNLYFETSDGEWYLFSTKRGKMFVLSSDQSFNDKVVNTKNKEVTDGKKGPIIYEFQPGNMTSKVTFIMRIQDYLSRIGEGVPTPQNEENQPEEEIPVEDEQIEEEKNEEDPDPGLNDGGE